MYARAPKEIKSRSICVEGDSAAAIAALRESTLTTRV